MKTFTWLLTIALSVLIFQALHAQDIFLTVSGEFHSEPASIDSILVENISNNTSLLFDSLPSGLQDYNINLTRQAFWGATGIRHSVAGNFFQPVVNFPGLLRLTYTGKRVIPLDITVFNLLGEKLYAIQRKRFLPNTTVSLHLGLSGIYLVRVCSPYGEQAFKILGADINVKKGIQAEFSGGHYLSSGLKNTKAVQNEGFTFNLGDSLRITAYKTGCYSESEAFRIDGSRSFHFFFREGLPPVADFSASPTHGRPPLTVTFTNLSYNDPLFWHWDFGNHVNDADLNPVITYHNVGKYTVSLVVRNSFGADTMVKEDYITVERCTSPIDLPWVEVPGGTFQMGCDTGDAVERPVHTVILDTFEITKYEISNAQYAQFLNAIGCRFDGHFNDPVYGDVRYIDMDNAQITYSGSEFKVKSGLEKYPVIEVS